MVDSNMYGDSQTISYKHLFLHKNYFCHKRTRTKGADVYISLLLNGTGEWKLSQKYNVENVFR